MCNIEKITKTPLFEITAVLDNFANLDYISRVDSIGNNKDSVLLPHEDCLLKVRRLLNGLISAIAYMRLSVLHIQKRYNALFFSTNGYKEYDVYRYHYYVFCHGVVTIHDLYFKLVVELCNLNISNKRMIQWKDLRKQLETKGEKNIIFLLEQFHSTFKIHEKKRDSASHEGLFSSKLLDNYYSSNVWTNAHKKNDVDNKYSEYTIGTKKNKYLLGKTKREFVSELSRLINEAIDYSVSLLELLLPNLLINIPHDFIDDHKQDFSRLNMESIYKYVL